MIKIAVYTCITDNYDTLRPPRQVDPRLDYYYFTNDPTSVVEPWTARPVGLPHLSPKDQNRFIKMHPTEVLPEYDATVYIDGYIMVVGDLYPLILSALNGPEDIFCYEHFQRNCVFAEAAACAHYSHDWIWAIALQMRRYKVEGYPLGNGLYEANVIIRRHTPRLRLLMETWWREYQAGVKRDQLSLPVVAWRLGIPMGSLGESDPRVAQRYFKLVNHPKRRSALLTVRKYVNRSVASLVPHAKLFGLAGRLRFPGGDL